MQHLIITNRGELQNAALTLLGASTKREDSSTIGFFGSGFKYSIAYLVRNDINFEIYSGTRKINITTQTEIFRGQHFSRICVDGEKTSITTETGPRWEIEDIIREIYSNALDEGEVEMFIGGANPRKDITTIKIELTDEIKKMRNNWGEYFSQDLPVIFEAGKNYQMLTPASVSRNYFMGIWCDEPIENKLYSYNLNNVTLDESRKASNWDTRLEISRLIGKVDVPSVIHKIIRSPNSFEHQLLNSINDYSGAWHEVVQEYDGLLTTSIGLMLLDKELAAKAVVVSENTLSALKRNFNITIANNVVRGRQFTECPMPELQLERIKTTMQKLDAAGYKIDYPIHGAKMGDSDCIALADFQAQKIYFNVNTLTQQSEIDLASTLLEEYFHLRENHHDETRAFQTFILDELAAKCLGVEPRKGLKKSIMQTMSDMIANSEVPF